MRSRPRRKRAALPAAALVLALALGGCAQTMQSMRSLGSSVFGSEGGEAAGASTSSVYYVGSDSLALYREPGKTVITRLERYQKVYRSKLSRGYAFVRVDGTDEAGWVDNAKLIWRLPKAEPAAAPSAAESAAPEPAVATTDEPAAAQETDGSSAAPASPTTVTAPPSNDDRGGDVRPSVFNPF